MSGQAETPNIVYGRLLESAHISGYSFERLTDELMWLLEGDRWQSVGPGYDDVNVFLRSIDLSPFNLGENRPQLHRRIKELQPKASNRAIAKATGVSEPTVRRDTASNDAPGDGAERASDTSDASNDAPPHLSRSAKQVARLNERDEKRARERSERERKAEEREAEMLAAVAEQGGPSWRIDVADAHDWRPEAVDAIITDPPYITADAVELVETVRDMAVECLRPGGALAVMTWQPILPDVVAVLTSRAELRYRWTAAVVTGSHEVTADHQRRIFDRWKPVVLLHADPDGDLEFGELTMVYDVLFTERHPQKKLHPWQQSLDVFRRLVKGLTDPGEVVCDPFVGAGTTAVAAIAQQRSFVGCDLDAEAVKTARERLAA